MERKAQAVYKQVLEDIITHKIDNRAFISENDIGKRFGVSRAPVRDALHLLCEQGYLVSFPRKGYMVNFYNNEQINKLQQIRRQLEKLSVQLAIENASDAQIESLREFTTEQQVVNTVPDESNNTRFHLKLADIGGNEFLSPLLRNVINRASMTMMGEESDFDRHEHIIDALLNRDLELAYKMLEEDIVTM